MRTDGPADFETLLVVTEAGRAERRRQETRTDRRNEK